jgi:pyridoxal phosphate enzyme (YggS family)
VNLSTNRDAILSRIAAACERAGRDPRDVELIWVSKTHPVETLLAAYDAGAKLFGENRVQEVLEKFPLPPLADGTPRHYELHLIGSWQRNKVRKVLPLCTTIHSVDSPELWEAINRIAGELSVRRRVLLQVNTSREPNKSGLAPETLMETIAALPAAPNLDLVGFMTMGPVEGGPDAARPCFRELAALLKEAQARFGASGTNAHPQLAKLSMGMSGDFEVAVEEGAHYVRVGSALFGSR